MDDRTFGAQVVEIPDEVRLRMRGDLVWPVALVLSALFTWWKFAPIAADLLNESLYIPLLAAWSLSLVKMSMQPSTRNAAWTGVIGGVTALARSTSVLAWAVVWPLCETSVRSRQQR